MSKSLKREIKHKSILSVYAFSLLTLGVYWVVWLVKSKRDMNSLGANIPTSWLSVIPFVGMFWLYKYCEGFSEHLDKKSSAITTFAISMFVPFILPFLVQSKLNDISILKMKEKRQLKAKKKQLEPVAA